MRAKNVKQLLQQSLKLLVIRPILSQIKHIFEQVIQRTITELIEEN